VAFWLDQVLGRTRSDARGNEAARDFAAVWDAIGDWMLRVRADGVLLASNQPAGSPFPPVSESSVGRPAGRLFPEPAAEVLRELIPRTLQNQKPSTFEYAFGEGFYAEVRMFPVGREEVVLVARDLTGRKSTEETLRRGRERYALAVQGANDGLWDWQLDSDYVYYSLHWKALLGLDREQVAPVPGTWFERIHPEDRDRVTQDLDRHLRGDTARFEAEHRIRHHTGEWMWVLVRGMALRDARGVPTRIAGSLTDLTHRRVVAAAEEKSRLLEYATRAVGIGIGILMPEGDLTQVSPTLAEMTGFWPDPMQWWHEVVATCDLPRGIHCPRCHRRQSVGSMLAEMTTPSGDPRLFEITVAGHAHEVHYRGDAHVVLVEDVTEQKLAEMRLKQLNAQLVVAHDRALASSRAKSTFLANMSHELRTPLNAIIGYSEMLMEELEDAEVDVGSDELERISSAGSHLLALIAEVLDLSKIEAGIMALECSRFSVAELVDEVHTLVAVSMGTAGNEFTTHCADDVGELDSDAGKLRQVLLNLLGNANKFTDQGLIRLDVRAEGPDFVVFEVSDTGIGIDEVAKAHLFEEFYQGDQSSTKRYAGAGLGLALCRRFTEMMGGTVAVTSTQGKGSTFTLRLPRTASEVVETPVQ